MMSQDFGIFVTFFLAAVMFAAAGKPVDCDDEDDDAVDGGDVVHIIRQYRLYRRETIHNEGKKGPCKKNIVREESNRTHPERAMRNVVTAFNQEAYDRDGVGYVE